MLNGKYISSKQIIEELYIDNGYQYELPWEDMMIWVENALNLIGHPSQYVFKVTGSVSDPNLDITNYRAKLPCDLHQVVQVSVDGYAAVYSGNSFHYLFDGDCCNVDGVSALTGDIFVDNFGNEFDTALGQRNSGKIVTYDLNDSYITLSIKEAEVCIAYTAFPIDDSGYPLIPEDISYKEAVKKYLTMKLDYIEWRRGTLPRDVFQHSEQEWSWYVGQASNKAKMPSIDKMESMKNSLVRLKPRFNEHWTFFRSLGRGEQRRMH